MDRLMDYSFGMHGVDWIFLIGVIVAAICLRSAFNRLK
jgi:hypothetical protein